MKKILNVGVLCLLVSTSRLMAGGSDNKEGDQVRSSVTTAQATNLAGEGGDPSLAIAPRLNYPRDDQSIHTHLLNHKHPAAKSPEPLFQGTLSPERRGSIENAGSVSFMLASPQRSWRSPHQGLGLFNMSPPKSHRPTSSMVDMMSMAYPQDAQPRTEFGKVPTPGNPRASTGVDVHATPLIPCTASVSDDRSKQEDSILQNVEAQYAQKIRALCEEAKTEITGNNANYS